MDAALCRPSRKEIQRRPHERGIHAVWPGCWRGQGDGSPVPVRTAAGGEARGTLELGYGRHAEAYEHLRRIHEPGDPACHYLNIRQMLGEFTEAAVRSGHRDEALALARELEPLGRRPPSPWFDLQMLYTRLHLADDDEAGAAFEDALSRDLSAWPVIHARIELSYGEWLRRRRRQVESRAPLRAARDAFDALGMHPWAERARQELRPRVRAASGPSTTRSTTSRPRSCRSCRWSRRGSATVSSRNGCSSRAVPSSRTCTACSGRTAACHRPAGSASRGWDPRRPRGRGCARPGAAPGSPRRLGPGRARPPGGRREMSTPSAPAEPPAAASRRRPRTGPPAAGAARLDAYRLRVQQLPVLPGRDHKR